MATITTEVRERRKELIRRYHLWVKNRSTKRIRDVSTTWTVGTNTVMVIYPERTIRKKMRRVRKKSMRWAICGKKRRQQKRAPNKKRMSPKRTRFGSKAFPKREEKKTIMT